MVVPIASLHAPVTSLAITTFMTYPVLLVRNPQDPLRSTQRHFPFCSMDTMKCSTRGSPCLWLHSASLQCSRVVAPIFQFSSLPCISSQVFQTPLFLIFLLPPHSILLSFLPDCMCSCAGILQQGRCGAGTAWLTHLEQGSCSALATLAFSILASEEELLLLSALLNWGQNVPKMVW